MRTLALLLGLFLILAPVPVADDVFLIPVEGEGAEYWPRWRGPSGQGLVAGSGYVDRWSPTGGSSTPTSARTA